MDIVKDLHDLAFVVFLITIVLAPRIISAYCASRKAE
jgi:hypothetical protein